MELDSPAARRPLAADEAVSPAHVLLRLLAARGDGDRARPSASSRSTRSTTRSTTRPVTKLVLVVAIFVAAGLANWGMNYVETYMTGWVGERILADLRKQLFGHLQQLSLGFYERNRAGVLISRMTNDVEAIDQLVTDGVTILAQSTLLLGGTPFILFLLDWRLALATLAVIPLMAIGTALFRFARHAPIGGAGAARPRHGHARRGHLRDADGAGVRTGAACDGELRRGCALDYRESNMQTVVLERPLLPLRQLPRDAGPRRRARLRRPPVLQQGDLARDAVRLHALRQQLLRPDPAALAALQHVPLGGRRPGQDHRRARRGARRSSTGRARGRSRTSRDTSASRTSTSPTGPRWRVGEEVLHGIDLDIPAGTTVALVGHTGAGKSTIAKLLARFYEPTSGRIAIDGAT